MVSALEAVAAGAGAESAVVAAEVVTAVEGMANPREWEYQVVAVVAAAGEGGTAE